MNDIFDYIFLYALALFLAVLKITNFIDWEWWVIALPVGIAVGLQFLVMLLSRRG